MAEIHFCPECGSNLPPDAPEGLCAACLMRAGFNDSPAPTQLSPGSFQAPAVAQLAAHFPQLEIQELLGQGGMGAVYRARQKALDRTVALKILPPQSAGDPAFAERFTREARALARLHHSNIVTVFEFGEIDGLYYLLMEFVDGVNLRQAIRSKQISSEQALTIVPQICDALQYAHEEGVVHRDIKPENILLDKRGRVKIADFGLAKLLRRSAIDVSLTATRQVVGTLHYMAPEQIERPLEVDHRADIYSLGVVFYELLTGELPVGRFKLPSEKATLDNRLDGVVLKTLEREPNDRYQNASDVKTDVQTISSSPQRVVPNGFHSKPQPEAPRAHPSPAVAPEMRHLDEQTVKGPGMALVVVGIIILASQLFAVLFMAMGWRVGSLAAAANTAGMIVGPLMIIGGLNMQRRSSHGWAMAGAIAGVLPFSPIWLLSAPVGIWALSVLRRSSSQTQQLAKPVTSREITEEEIEEARDLVRAPGMALVAVGMIDLLIVVGLLIVLLLRVGVRPMTAVGLQVGPVPDTETIMPAWALLVPTILGVFLQIPVGLLVLLGGISLARLRTRTLAFMASFAAMLPLHVGCVLGFPIGLWALATLMRADVREAFGARRQITAAKKLDYPSDTEFYGPSKRSGASIGLVGVTIFLVLFVALVVLALFGFGFSFVRLSPQMSAPQ